MSCSNVGTVCQNHTTVVFCIKHKTEIAANFIDEFTQM